MATIEGRVLESLRHGVGPDLGENGNVDEGLKLGQAKIGVVKREGIQKAGGKRGGKGDGDVERHVRERIPVEGLLKEVVLLDQIGAQAVCIVFMCVYVCM